MITNLVVFEFGNYDLFINYAVFGLENTVENLLLKQFVNTIATPTYTFNIIIVIRIHMIQVLHHADYH